MSHLNGGWLLCRDESETDLRMSDSNPEREFQPTSTTSSALRHRISQQNGSVDALAAAQHPPEELSSSDRYSRSDATVIKGWRGSRPLTTTQQVLPGTIQPKFSLGSPALLRPGPVSMRKRKELQRAETLVGDLMGQQPECPVCLEAYCENHPSKIPRSLNCGHSICTG